MLNCIPKFLIRNSKLSGYSRLLFLPLGDLLCEFLLEAFYAACRIDKLLLAGEEWMAIRANFNANRFARGCRARFKLVATTAAVDRDRMVIRMDSFFHVLLLWGLTDVAVPRLMIITVNGPCLTASLWLTFRSSKCYAVVQKCLINGLNSRVERFQCLLMLLDRGEIFTADRPGKN
jgi:hypothetical protein